MIEEPFKHHHYVALLVHLAATKPSEGAEETDPETGEKRKAVDSEPDCGHEILEDLGRAFRSAVEGREWLSARLLVSNPMPSKSKPSASVPLTPRTGRTHQPAISS